MNELALFSGAGGGILGGLLCGFRTVCAVEVDPYCREVLLRRQEEGILPPFPIWDDIRSFDGAAWAGAVDIVTAGFPCQPFSVAGKRRGKDDERNLWPDTIRVISEVRPEWILLENVPGLLSTEYIWQIAAEISEAGYYCAWDVISAAEVGAPHRRARWWLVGHSEHLEQAGSETSCESPRPGTLADANHKNVRREHGDLAKEKDGRQGINTSFGACGPNVSDSTESGLERHDPEVLLRRPERLSPECSWWKTEPRLGRVADGVACRVDRLKAIGNGQVPEVVKTAWNVIAGYIVEQAQRRSSHNAE
jgi:DNA (cytosine-5)-methyltransferase 1